MIDIHRVPRLFEAGLDVARHLHEWRLDQQIGDWWVVTRLLEINAENVIIVLRLVIGHFAANIWPISAHKALVCLAEDRIETFAWFDDPIDRAQHRLHNQL